MDALFSHALPFVFQVLAQCLEQVTPVFLRGEPGAQREHGTDLGQSTCPEARPVAVHYIRAQQCRPAACQPNLQQGTREGTLDTRPGSQLPCSLVSWDSQNQPEFQGGARTTKKGPGLGVETPDLSASSLGCVPWVELPPIPGLSVLYAKWERG